MSLFQDEPQAAQFALLTIYEQRINRNVQRNLKLLHELQAERKAQHEHDMEEAQLLAQLSLANGVSYDPKRDGFVFSTAEINHAIDRAHRLKTARNAARQQFPAARAA